MFGLSPVQFLICAIVAVLLFGKNLPSVARSLGKSLTEFKRGLQDLQFEFNDAMREADRAVRSDTSGSRASLPAAARTLHDDSAPDASYDTFEQPPEEGERRAEIEGSDDATGPSREPAGQAETVDSGRVAEHDAPADGESDDGESADTEATDVKAKRAASKA